jgi:serine/threonine protein kinase
MTFKGSRRYSGGSPPKPEFNIGDVICNRFEITNVIGQGTYGDVYLAKDQNGTQEVAVKIDRKNVNNLFLLEEAKILEELANLKVKTVPRFIMHGKVVQDVEDKRMFLVMQRHGESLSTIRKKFKKAVPLQICSRLFIEMVNALESFHEAGYIHRDIKPVSCGKLYALWLSNFKFSQTFYSLLQIVQKCSFQESWLLILVFQYVLKMKMVN